MAKHESEENYQKVFEVPIKKFLPHKKQVFGWASVVKNNDGSPLIDLDGDIITEQELEKSAYGFVLSSRVGGEAHKNFNNIATLIESLVFTEEKKSILGVETLPTGWWVGFQIHDDSVFEKVLNGELSMFSIGACARRVPRAEA